MTSFIHNLRSRWFVACVHLGLWLLLYITLHNIGGKAPELHESDGSAGPVQSPVPVARLEGLLAPEGWPRPVPGSSLLSSFYTRYFIPPVAPTPPPPTTKKIELTYQGYFETEGGPKKTMVKLGPDFLVTAIGDRLTANLFSVDANILALTLTNSAGITNILMLNTKKELEVPIQ